MDIFAYFLLLLGGFSVIGCLFYFDLFLELLGLPALVNLLGRSMARWFYLVVSLTMVTLALMILFKVRI